MCVCECLRLCRTPFSSTNTMICSSPAYSRKKTLDGGEEKAPQLERCR